MRRFGWLVVNTLQWLFIAGWTALLFPFALLASLAAGRSAGLAMARRVWAPAVVRVALAKIETVGTEGLRPGDACLIACNHRSFADIPALFVALPVDLRFVAKRELRNVPVLGWYMAAMGMVFVDRRRRRSGAAGVGQAAALLRSGAAVLSFPSGTRRAAGEPQQFKPAAFAAALQAGVPVVPTAIAGSDRVLPTRRLALRPGTIRVVVGDPIPTRGRALDDRGQLAADAEARVEGMLRELEGPAAPAEAAGARRLSGAPPSSPPDGREGPACPW